jgi:hypothetical protein
MNDKCLFCKKDIGMDIEFGNPELHAEGVDGDGWTCSDECHQAYQAKISKEMEKIGDMTDEQFIRHMTGA